jgi:hypothetical protein
LGDVRISRCFYVIIKAVGSFSGTSSALSFIVNK